jgi:RNA polymerase sigma factor (sigma-70 family)
MDEQKWLAERFEENRSHLRAVAYRMLGSLSEAEDAVQEAWLRLSRADTSDVQNLGGCLTSVVARVCLDVLRSRKSRREEALDSQVSEPVVKREGVRDPEQEALLADSVGLVLLVVLDRLSPAERLAFVLHDLFAVSFEEIASITGRTAASARQLASRARRRVQGKASVPETDLAGHRRVVDAFLAALRAGDVEGLVAVLDPEVVIHVDKNSAASGKETEVRGARDWATQAVTYARGAKFAQTALVDGEVGVILAPRGKLFRALEVKIVDGKIARIDVVGDPARLRELELAVLEDQLES